MERIVILSLVSLVALGGIGMLGGSMDRKVVGASQGQEPASLAGTGDSLNSQGTFDSAEARSASSQQASPSGADGGAGAVSLTPALGASVQAGVLSVGRLGELVRAPARFALDGWRTFSGKNKLIENTASMYRSVDQIAEVHQQLNQTAGGYLKQIRNVKEAVLHAQADVAVAKGDAARLKDARLRNVDGQFASTEWEARLALQQRQNIGVRLRQAEDTLAQLQREEQLISHLSRPVEPLPVLPSRIEEFKSFVRERGLEAGFERFHQERRQMEHTLRTLDRRLREFEEARALIGESRRVSTWDADIDLDSIIFKIEWLDDRVGGIARPSTITYH